MPLPGRIPLAALIVALGLFPAAAVGQMGMGGPGRSLGGYGSATIGPYYSGSSQLPVGGRIAVLPGPSRRIAETSVGGVSAPTFRPAPGAMMGARRPIAGGMGMGLGGSVGMPMTRSSGMRRASPGPGLGWPFTVPPNLAGPGPMGMP